MPPPLIIGTAGWSVPRAESAEFPGEGSHLQRYSRTLPGVEINSSFYRPHQPATYARWAMETPSDFQFSVKLPKTLTHTSALSPSKELLLPFLEGVAELGDRLKVLLIQLPPSLAWDRTHAAAFFRLLSKLTDVAAVCEPRHPSWFTPQADQQLRAARIGRVAVDPAPHPDAALPGGWLGPQDDGAGAVLYRRWHGSPRMYWSSYEAAWLQSRADELLRWHDSARQWVIFDNTASGAATRNALDFQALTGTSDLRPPMAGH